MTRPERQRGSLSLELVFVAPGLIVLLLFVSVGGKILAAKGQVQGAARDAARAASLSRNDANGDAEAAARQTLNGKLKCQNSKIVSLPNGTPSAGDPVTAIATCTVSVATLGLPGFPGEKTLSVAVVSPVDSYVGRD